MTQTRQVGLFYDERMLAHRPQAKDQYLPGRLNRRVREIIDGLAVTWNYPEHPGRLTAVLDALARTPVEGLSLHSGSLATRAQLARVHTMSFLDDLDSLRDSSAWLDTDTTAVSPGSVEAAEVAAGTAMAAVEAVVAGRLDSAFALVRPPGHHAETARARGFCLFNNIAVAAAHAQAELGCPRVLIVDWDAHHANGTQQIFYADPDIMLFDIHRAAPFYPGTGSLYDTGAGRGEGTTINVPLAAGSGDVALVKAFNDILVPAARWFRPDLILVSAGFDPHRLDLALNASAHGFAAMTGVLRNLAEELCQGRLAFVLEGGYHLEALAEGVRTVLNVLAGGPVPDVAEPGLEEVDQAAAFHRDAFIEGP